MMLNLLRRVRMVFVISFIVGGLWLLADWRSNLTDKAPAEFQQPIWNWQNLARGNEDSPTDRPSVIDRLRDTVPQRGMVMPS
jgi:hypothetical protein